MTYPPLAPEKKKATAPWVWWLVATLTVLGVLFAMSAMGQQTVQARLDCIENAATPEIAKMCER